MKIRLKSIKYYFTCAVRKINFLGGSICCLTKRGGSPCNPLNVSIFIAGSPRISAIDQTGLSNGRILCVSAR